MEKLDICRVCLSQERRMSEVICAPIQEVYQKLTGVPTHMNPFVVCYICHALLRKTYSLMTSCVRAERLLTKMLQAEDVVPLKLGVIELSLSMVSKINIQAAKDSKELIQDGRETQNICRLKSEISVKQEIENNLQETNSTEYEENFKFEERIQDDIPNYEDLPPSDPEDDLPLTTIKNQETSEKTKSIEKNKIKKSRENKKKIKMKVTPTYTEIELTKEEQLKNLLDRAKSENYLRSPFKCDSCYKGFVDANAFENHNERHNERSGSLACLLCGVRFRSERARAAHAHSAHARLYRCTRCAHQARTKSQAKEHQKWHTGIKYDCKLCGREFRKPTTYMSHLRKSHPSEHVCELCGDSFVGLHGLKVHKTKAHYHFDKTENSLEPPEERYCGDCKIQFHSKDAWLRHVVHSIKHSAKHEQRSQCEVCGWAGARSLRRAHVRSHGRSLKRARTDTSDAPQNHWCGECNASFAYRSSLDAHVKRVHLGLKYNKNVVCEICGKKCTSNATLSYHQRTHTGERPYPCTTCNKSFADSNQLRIHTRTHTGEKPYVCAHCGKRFTQKPALNRHYRVHTGDKPYTCQLCSRTFSQSNSLHLHVRTVHSKEPRDKRRKLKSPTLDIEEK